MRDAFVDVMLEIPLFDLERQADEDRYIIERLRDAADAKCERAGAELRTDVIPEFVVEKGTLATTGEDYALIATRWACRIPDAVEGELQRQ